MQKQIIRKTNKNMTKREFKLFVQDVYIEYRYLFQNYRKDVTHFTKNGKYQEWNKNKLRKNVRSDEK